MARAIDTAVVGTLGDMPREAWDALVNENDPFMEHDFLFALEQSGSVGAEAGWQPRFVLARDGAEIVGAVPLYLKDNSYGEFIFDWSWASGAMRAGVRYFPKLVAAVPFTPATGRRILIRPDADADAVTAALLAGVRRIADETGASSVHFLFHAAAETERLQAAGYLPRLSMQFHWTNRDPPYRDFADFLGAFRSRNRKQVRKERTIAAGHGLRLATLEGPALSARDWNALEIFYNANAFKHGASNYLTPAFFDLVRTKLAHRVVATLAYRGDEPVAGSLNFERGQQLYGRYWGCTEEHEMLHFEMCYYRLIERAIERGHTRFEAGAQGEHKLKRGLAPSLTYSAHWIRHPELGHAVDRFIREEAERVREVVAEYDQLSPYRSAGEPES